MLHVLLLTVLRAEFPREPLSECIARALRLVLSIACVHHTMLCVDTPSCTHTATE